MGNPAMFTKRKGNRPSFFLLENEVQSTKIEDRAFASNLDRVAKSPVDFFAMSSTLALRSLFFVLRSQMLTGFPIAN
jgi:hypothetical protein